MPEVLGEILGQGSSASRQLSVGHVGPQGTELATPPGNGAAGA